MRGAFLALVACLALTGACTAPKPVRAPPPAPRLDVPALAMPADLDLVARFDLERLSGLLGPALRDALHQVLAKAPSSDPDAETSRLLLLLLSKSDTLWIGLRPGPTPELTDNVVVLRGRFSGLVPRAIGGEPQWWPPRDLGGGVRRFERPQPPLRAAPAVLYVREPDLVVIGSTAEIDALELGLEEGGGDAPLRAPDAGFVSLAARVPRLLARVRGRAPSLVSKLEGAGELQARVDATGKELLLEASLDVASEAQARNLTELGSSLAGAFAGPLERFGVRVKIEPVARVVVVRAKVPAAVAAAGLGCALRGGC